MTAASWLILADDLTGAADSAVAFAARGVPTTVGWGGRRPAFGPSPSVFAYDSDSRGLDRAEATRRRRALTASLPGAEARLFVKIDTTLRGQPAAEIGGVLQALDAGGAPALALLAPAFPATGRTTVESRVRVGGEPLERTELWRRDHSYPDANLIGLLASEGLSGLELPLSVVRSPMALARVLADTDAQLAVCDAETDDDLDRIAQAGLALRRAVVWIGAGGLAGALARAAPAHAPAPIEVPVSRQGVLVVVGSPAAASRLAAAGLARTEGVLHIPLAPASLLAPDGPDFAPALLEALDLGRDVLIDLVPGQLVDLSRGPEFARALGRRLRGAGGRIGALAVTGGETAAALLSAFGVDGVRLADQIEPGVSVGLTLGEHSFPLVTKAGAFGDEDVLVRAVDRLLRIKREGRLA